MHRWINCNKVCIPGSCLDCSFKYNKSRAGDKDNGDEHEDSSKCKNNENSCEGEANKE